MNKKAFRNIWIINGILQITMIFRFKRDDKFIYFIILNLILAIINFFTAYVTHREIKNGMKN